MAIPAAFSSPGTTDWELLAARGFTDLRFARELNAFVFAAVERLRSLPDPDDPPGDPPADPPDDLVADLVAAQRALVRELGTAN